MTKSPPHGRRIAPRAEAEAELRALLDEIPQWPDDMLMHMHRRYGESRLFRVHHAPDGVLTERARTLLNATRSEMMLRGLTLSGGE
ncbi:hypothetical protein [Pelagibacterium sediminicola]|uniref:hypothetical protein n=1 Tax=Pelagibacterium sediminicola TaxID=2248761 RepID=UPI0013007B56|nr:hypothetical protein [Pelagibacterium sediminicola]